MDDDAAELGELVLRAARTQRHRWRDALAPWSLSPHQARALRVVVDREGARVTEVADALQERGLAERTPDPTDRRAVLLRATAEGRRVQAEVDAARRADTRELFGRLSAAERTELARLLRSVAE